MTGGNGGIGLGMARALAEAGADIAIWGTNPAKNADAHAELASDRRWVIALECDVSDEAAVERAFADTRQPLGRVDACFANAGAERARQHRILYRDERRGMAPRAQVNLDGAFFTFRTAARHMVERGGGGALVGTASLAAIEGAPRSEQYAATKGGVDLDDPGAGGGIRALRRTRQCDSAGLDRDRHDRQRA